MIRLILTIIVLIIIASFFGISLQSVINSPLTHANFLFVWQLIVQSWDALLASLRSFAHS